MKNDVTDELWIAGLENQVQDSYQNTEPKKKKVKDSIQYKVRYLKDSATGPNIWIWVGE
jgi:hypothetical protein